MGDAVVQVTVVTNGYSSRPNLVELTQGADSTDVRILLAHQPSPGLVSWASEAGYHLLTAGHTHGGQIVMNWWGEPFTPVLSETPFLTGIYRIKGLTVSVNNGLGFTAAPIRYHAPAEVTLLTLTRQ